jgi:serine/threonine-protein kinase
MDTQLILKPTLTLGALGAYPAGPEALEANPMLVCPLCRIVLSADQPSCPRDGTAGVEQPVESLPQELAERFSVVEVFALGETGTLYLADEPQTGRRGLLKVLRPAGPTHTAERQRVKRELVKQATLSNANLALPQATGEAGSATWLFREWIDGVSLRVRLARNGAFPMPEALAIAAQLATALDELHRAGLLHRDLKPGHILLQPQANGLARVLVIDSGIAAHVRSTQVFDVHGTAAYVSPEQATGKLVSFRSDLYSLGCVLYEMLAGAPPFAGDEATLLESHATRPVPALPVQLPTGVRSLLESLLAKEPRERPFSAQQVRRALEPFLPEATSSSRDSTMAFEPASGTAASIDAVRAGNAARGSGTLRPPSATMLGMPALGPELAASPGMGGAPPQKSRSATMLGMPAVVAPGASRPPPPPPPPAPSGAQDLRVAPASKPPPPPPPGGTPPRDVTEELSPLDVEQAEQILARPPEDLDYDELAETKAVDVQRVMQQGLEAASAPLQPPPAGFALPDYVPAEQQSQQQPGYGAPQQQQQAGYGAPQQQQQAGYGAPQQQQAGYGAPQQQAYSTPGAYSSPGAETSPGAYTAQPAKKKKSKVGLFILVGLLGFCLFTSAAGVGGYFYLQSKATELMNTPLGLGTVGQPGVGVEPFPSGTGLPSTGLPSTGLPGTGVAGNGLALNPTVVPPVPEVPAVVPVVPAEPARVALSLNTMPAGATAIVDDGERCTTPCSLQVTATSHNVRFELTGHLTRTEIVDSARTGAVVSTLEANAPVEAPPVVAANTPTGGGTERAPGGDRAGTRTGTERTGGSHPAETGTTPAGTGTTTAANTGTGGTATRPAGGGTGTTAAAAASPFDTLREAARAHFAGGRYREAAAAYERAAALNPSHAGTFAGLGASRMQLNDYRGAVAAYEKAVQLQPSSAGFLAALGRAHLAAGNRDRARAAFQRALGIDPNNAAARQGMQQVGG